MKRVLIIIVISLLLIGGIYIGYKKLDEAISYQYTLNDVYYKHYASDNIFDVSVSKIRKEKGKEDIYLVNFETFSSSYNISIDMPKSTYEEIIGSENNSISSNVYVLSFGVPAKYKARTRNRFYYIDIYRYSFLEENDFSEEEINYFASLALDVFSEANTSNAQKYDLSLMREKAKSYCLSLVIGSSRDGLSGMLKLKE